MSYSITFELPGLPRMANASGRSRNFWAIKKETDQWKKWVGQVACPRPPSPLVRAKLTLIRFSSSEPDFDGLVHGFKPVIDGLKECGVLLDDKARNIGQSSYSWEKAPAKQGKIRVVVEALE